jgi:hypothetical protein
MKYMLLIYGNQIDMPELEPEQQQAQMQEWLAFVDEAQAAGVLLNHDGFAPVSYSTTVRVRDDKTLITDGPFAETHEQLAGFFLLNCENLDEAIGWAAKIPGAKQGSIEIRPLWNAVGRAQ